jgi:hypothetical protein
MKRIFERFYEWHQRIWSDDRQMCTILCIATVFTLAAGFGNHGWWLFTPVFGLAALCFKP